MDAAPQLICGFDTETHLIAAGDIIPRLVVATFDVAQEGRVSPSDDPRATFKAWAVGNATDEPLHQLLEVFQEVYQRRMHLVIQAANFDLSVAMRYCLDIQAGLQFGEPDMAKELYALIWETLERSLEDEWAGGRPLIHDTIIRDKLWHLSTHGSVDSWHGRDLRFSLSDLVERSFSVDISGFKVTTDASGRVFSHDGRDITGTAEAGAAWRLRYSELDRVHLSQWPPEALQYAIDDASWARKVWEVQEGRRQPRGHGSMNSASLQVYADLALRLYSATGFRLDQERVQRVEATIDAQLGKVREALRLNGIERPNGTVNTAVVKERVENAWKVLGRPPMLTEKEGGSAPGARPWRSCRASTPSWTCILSARRSSKSRQRSCPRSAASACGRIMTSSRRRAAAAATGAGTGPRSSRSSTRSTFSRCPGPLACVSASCRRKGCSSCRATTPPWSCARWPR